MTDEFRCVFCQSMFYNADEFTDHSRLEIRIGNPVGGSK